MTEYVTTSHLTFVQLVTGHMGVMAQLAPR